MSDQAPPDWLIIGSGINALVAAAMLGKKGASVHVVERNEVIGGCIRSGQITDPGFTHDLMAATFVLFITSPAYAALGDDLARHGLEFCNGASPTGVLRPDGSSLILSTDREANVARFEGLAKGDGPAYRAEVEHVEQNAELLFGILGGPAWSGATAKLLGKSMFKKGGTRKLAATLGAGLIPSRGWLETRFQGDLLRDLLAPWSLHAGLSPEASYSGGMAQVIAFALEAAGAPVVKGGSGAILTAFRALIEEQGGRITTGADVDRIVVSNGKATGVLLGSDHLRAKKGVIASVAPGQLYGRLLDEDAAGEKRAQAAQYRHGKGNFQLHYALNGQPDWGDAALGQVALLHLTPGLDGVSKATNEAERGMLPEVPTICVGQPVALDPSRAPDGKAILWCQMPEAPRVIKGDAAGQIDPGDGTWTEALREAYADRIEAILRAHIKNFDAIKGTRVAYSPADLEAMNINLVGGDPYGGAATLDQFFLFRPFPDTVNHRTHIKGLHHIGASTHPGPGLSGGSGFLVAGEV